ncbi:5-oxoprolinase/urea amidolyase family protein [Pseudescherichia sp.]|uniref:5-oxoprolinase/urea amidolyase family protein n=1 Tax=Pseudescherichia sp. TaxID=2055881 RepID=UPI0028A9DDB7|nr:5-oxoprolinase/urea amidolyase family protein [Pseudescherichia sp.]
MFDRVLIANRGEIACRAIRTLQRLGIVSIAVYSDADKNAEHVKAADIALPLGGEKASDSYLRIDSIIDAAKQSGAQAIWPGYGFLSESLAFADACEQAGIVFVGPTAQQIGEFGLKHRARELAAQAGVPMTPGTGLLNSLDEALRAAEEIGYPVMLKSTAGGGGIGLTRCADAEALQLAWESVRRLGEQFFSDAGVFIERCIDRARHVEVQIFGDGLGNVVALGERDCSLQRRNQKVVEETPAPGLPESTRTALLASAVELGKLVNYRSAGTVEYIYDAEQDAFYFLEVNTRLQVEHPVTECVTGLDLVECMLRVAAGDSIDWERLQRPPLGAAIEVRLYAENPLKNFQPSPGVLTHVSFPENVRVDSGVTTGSEVSAFYDPMIAKLIVHAQTRDQALVKLREALDATQLHGIATNLDYLRQIVASEAFTQGSVWTRMLDTFTPATAAIEVVQPGTWSSVQDHPGRPGYWDVGVPPSGPMDDFAFRLANRIVGNHASAAGLEFTLQGPTLQGPTLLFHSDTTIALTGADCHAELDGQPVAYWQPVAVKAGQTLVLGRAQSGCRTYLAVRNGIDVPCYLGSRATFALGQFGGHAGRTLKVADLLPISRPELAACTTPAPERDPQPLAAGLIPEYGENWHIGVLYGPHGAPDFFTQESIDEFFASEWQVHYNSNRLGVRLTGPKPAWTRPDGGEAGLHPSADRNAVRDTIFDASYLILGLGDVYLGAPCAVPVDPRHRLLSSKYNPARTFTAEGTVGIGGMYMCIYGMDSPGGYQLVGRTLPIWNKFLRNSQFKQDEPWLLRFFDQVRFYPVSEEELDRLRDDFREGRATIRIEETEFDYAEHLRFLAQNATDIAQFRERQAAAFSEEVARWQLDEQPQPEEIVLPVADAVDDGALAVNADMNGNIWKVLVQAGDEVIAGQPLVIVEAMKMELAIHAPQAGRIKRIGCQPGRPVSPGDALLWLEQ